MEVMGYTCKTTFWQDFTIADKFGAKAIKDAFKQASEEWRNDRIYGTELSLVLNWKCHYHYETGEDELSRLYAQLWEEYDAWILDNWKQPKLGYYLEITD